MLPSHPTILRFDLQALRQNVTEVQRLCGTRRASLQLVLKAISARPELVMAVSRNVHRAVVVTDYKTAACVDRGAAILHVRPTRSECDLIADAGIHVACSERHIIQQLARAGARTGKTVPLHLMQDIGDGREGVPLEHLRSLIDDVKELPGIRLEGLCGNIGCFNEEAKLSETLRLLVAGLQVVRNRGLEITTVSVGTSIVLSVPEHEWPEKGITAIRVGEPIFVGVHSVPSRQLSVPLKSCFELDCEILHSRRVGAGRFECVAAVGYESIEPDDVMMVGEGVIRKVSQSHSLISSRERMDPGERIRLAVGYKSLVRATNSQSVMTVIEE